MGRSGFEPPTHLWRTRSQVIKLSFPQKFTLRACWLTTSNSTLKSFYAEQRLSCSVRFFRYHFSAIQDCHFYAIAMYVSSDIIRCHKGNRCINGMRFGTRGPVHTIYCHHITTWKRNKQRQIRFNLRWGFTYFLSLFSQHYYAIAFDFVSCHCEALNNNSINSKMSETRLFKGFSPKDSV